MLQKSSALKDFLCQSSSEVSREKCVQQSYLRLDFAPHSLFIYSTNFFAPLRMALPILRSKGHILTTTSTTLSNNYCARNNTTSAQGE